MSNEPLKTYLQYQKDYGQQTWQTGDLLRDTPSHKIT